MSTLLNTESTEVIVIAAMLGCAPAAGLVNVLNELHRTGQIAEGNTYGDILIAYLTFKLAEANRYKAERAA